jgi:hypothetical protein
MSVIPALRRLRQEDQPELLIETLSPKKKKKRQEVNFPKSKRIFESGTCKKKLNYLTTYISSLLHDLKCLFW